MPPTGRKQTQILNEMIETGNNRGVGLTLVGFLVAAAPAVALEAVDVLNFTWGKLTVKPQLDLTGTFTDNLFYGNNSVRISTNTVQHATNLVSVVANVPVFAGGAPSGPITSSLAVLRTAESDYQTIVSPGFQLAYGSSDANQIAFTYSLDKILYLRHGEDGSDQHNFDLKTKLADGHWKLTGADQLQYLSSFLGGGNFFSLGQLVNRRLWNDTYRFNYDLSPKTYAYFDGTHSSLDYDKGINVYDTDTLKGSIGGGYYLSPLVSVFVETHYGQSAIAPNLPGQLKGPHSGFYGGYLGLRGDFTARLTGMVKVGYETRVFPAGSVPSSGTSTPAVEVSLTYAPTVKSQITLDYSRKTDVSPQFGRQTLSFDTISLAFQQTIGSSGKWFVQVQGNYSLTDSSDLTTLSRIPTVDPSGNFLSYNVLGGSLATGTADLQQAIDPKSAPVPINVGRTDVQASLGPTLVYQPRPWLQASLGYRFEHYTPRFRDAYYASLHTLIPYDVNQFTFRIAVGF